MERVSSETTRLDQTAVLPTYGRLPLEVVGGEGCELIGIDGRRYLDFVTGLSVSNFGHCHPRVVQAVREQVGRLIHCSNLYYTRPQAQLAERLSRAANGGKVFFGNSGAEANEAAIKIARKRSREVGGGAIVTLERSFHGRTMATLSATGQREKQAAFSPTLEVFQHVAPGDATMLEQAFRGGRVAAFLAEPVLGESGVQIVPAGFLRRAQELCREFDALFIVDEVQTGLGRCGAAFAYQRYGLDPDIVTVAKSLAGGLPIGAAIVGERAWDVLRPGDHGSTFGGGPVVAAAGLAIMDLLEEPGLFERVEARGRRLEAILQRLIDRAGAVAVRRLGLMAAVDLPRPKAKELVVQALEDGILLNATSEKTLRFLPPLIVSEEQIDRVGDWLLQNLCPQER
ncbi:MAG: acetylornithine transaminase [Thermoleophilia bacterium]